MPVRAIRPTLELSAPDLPPTLLKESLRARLPSLAWVLPGLRACLIEVILGIPQENFQRNSESIIFYVEKVA